MTVLVMNHKEIDRMAVLRDLVEKRLKVAAALMCFKRRSFISASIFKTSF